MHACTHYKTLDVMSTVSCFSDVVFLFMQFLIPQNTALLIRRQHVLSPILATPFAQLISSLFALTPQNFSFGTITTLLMLE